MGRKIKLSIDLAKINKNKIRVNGQYKNYDILLIETPNSKYGDWMAVESQTKEESEARQKGNILGNAKNIGWSGSSKPQDDKPVSSSDLPI